MSEQMIIQLPSENYGHEPGVLLEFIDNIVVEGKVTSKTAYNYYMVARTLVKHLRKWRNNLDAPPDEICLTEITTDELMSITQEEWSRYLDYYRRLQRERDNSFAFRITVFRRLYTWLESKTGVPAPDFIFGTPLPKHKARKLIAVSESKTKEILSNLQGEFRSRNICIVLLALRCGLGVDEISALQMEDLELNQVKVKEKNGRVRTIPLTDDVKIAIDRYLVDRLPPLDGENPLFVSKKYGTMKRGAMHKMLMKAVARSEHISENITFRDLQQTWGHRVALQGYQDIINQGRTRSSWYIAGKYYMNKPDNVVAERAEDGYE